MAIQTSFAEKVTRFQNSYDCFLAPLGNDGELDLALLNVKNGVRRITLPEHNFILSIIYQNLPARGSVSLARGNVGGSHRRGNRIEWETKETANRCSLPVKVRRQ